jgi:multidrug efflux pump subunit AcrB
MKGTRIIAITLAMLLVFVPSAFAATTTRVYSSSILVLVFVGFLALVVVIQLIPAIMTLIWSLKGIAKKKKNSGTVKVEAGD